MHLLDGQIEAMILDSSVDKEFWGNTHKWWASFLTEEKSALSLHQRRSLPICLVHGVEDMQIPVESADSAAEILSREHELTYLRLEGYGHDVDTVAVRAAAYRWLQAVLLGQEIPIHISVGLNNDLASSSENTKVDGSDDVYSRGKKEDKNKASPPPNVNGGFSVHGDETGASGQVEVDINKKFNNNFELGMRAQAYGQADTHGNMGGGGSVTFHGGKNY